MTNWSDNLLRKGAVWSVSFFCEHGLAHEILVAKVLEYCHGDCDSSEITKTFKNMHQEICL